MRRKTGKPQAEKENEISLLKEEISPLNSQLKKGNDSLEDMKKTQFSYENLQREREAAGKGSFEFYTGLSLRAFDSFWEYLEP